MDREQQVGAILSFVDQNRYDPASRMICGRILGEKDREIDDELVGELHAKLPRAKKEVLDVCYHSIQ